MASQVELLAYARDVRQFRLIGMALYQGVIGLVVIATLGSASYTSGNTNGGFLILLCTILLGILQLLPAAALSFLQIAQKPIPFLVNKRIPWLSKRILKVDKRVEILLGRLLDSQTGPKAWSLFSVHIFCAAVFIFIDSWRKGHTVSGTLSFGAILGSCLAAQIAASESDVLTIPFVHRHRLLCLKSRIGPAIWRAVQVEFVAVGLTILIQLGNGRISDLYRKLPVISSLTYSVCSMIGVETVRVIFSEPLSFEGRESLGENSLLDLALIDEKDPLTQLAAFQRLMQIAKCQGTTGSLRKEIFSDDSGKRWQIIAAPCLQEVTKATKILASSLPEAPSQASTSNQEWNRPVMGSQQMLNLPGAKLDVSAWAIRSRYQQLSFALRTLTEFCKNSKTEDHFGILQLSEPGLATIVASILSLELVLSKATKSLDNRRDSFSSHGVPEESLFALRRLLSLLLQSLVSTFGEDLGPLVRSSRQNPEFGSLSEVSQSMQVRLKGQNVLTVHDFVPSYGNSLQLMNGV